ncbi:MAG: hypothetical protein V1721_07615 [Pseudomonadota bacterium]
MPERSRLKILRKTRSRAFDGRTALDGSGLHFNTIIIGWLKK